MKRDITIALGIGFILGGLAAILITNLPELLKNFNQKNVQGLPVNTSVTITKMPQAVADIELDQPQDQSISPDKNITISGKTKSAAAIVLNSDTDIKVLEASGDGHFSSDTVLSEGANNFTLTAFDTHGDSISKEITVYYTPEKL